MVLYRMSWRTCIPSVIIQPACFILCYFPLSVGLTFYNKWFLRHFKFPLFIVLCHYIVKFMLAAICRRIRRFSRSALDIDTPILLDWHNYICRIAPIGLTASIDIGLSTWSLEFITISLYTMSKSATIVFILMFAILFRLEVCHWIICVIVALIALGLFLFTFESTQFDLIGFILVEIAATCSGVRWTVAQIVAQKHKLGLHNPIDMMYHVQPWMTLSIIPLVLAFESHSLIVSSNTFDYNNLSSLLYYLGLAIAGALIAFLMELTEYGVVASSSSLTLSMCGIVKEIVTLTLAHYINKDQMSWINFTGLVLCLTGVTLHVLFKARQFSNNQSSSDENNSKELHYRLLKYDDSDASDNDNIVFDDFIGDGSKSGMLNRVSKSS